MRERIGGDIWNFFFEQQLAPVVNPTRPENQRLLLAQVKHEVVARLDQSLHNAVLINLGKELQPQQVKRPWDAEIKIGLKPPEPLPENTSIVEVFDSSAIASTDARKCKDPFEVEMLLLLERPVVFTPVELRYLTQLEQLYGISDT